MLITDTGYSEACCRRKEQHEMRLSAREIARQASQISSDETSFTVTTGKLSGRGVHQDREQRYLRDKEKFNPATMGKITDDLNGEWYGEVQAEMKTIPVNHETVKKFLGGEHVRPETVRLIELVAVRQVKGFSRVPEGEIRPEVILESWYGRKFRVLPVKG